MGAPLVSVIVPTYNAGSMLHEALDSVRAQTLPAEQIEVIVVDDGSTDDTWDYLTRFKELMPGLVAIHQDNTGLASVGRNKGIRAATGRYLFFLDADDWLGPDALRRLIEAAQRHGSDIVVGRGRGVNRFIPPAMFRRTVVDADIFEDSVWTILGPWKLFRTDLVRRLGASFPEDMRQGEDQVFVATALFGASRITILADYDYYYVRGRADGQNVSMQPQPLRNKLLTTTRMTELIVTNVPPGRARDQAFRRVILKTLPSALNRGLKNSGGVSPQQFLEALQEKVFPYVSSSVLDSAGDYVRLRLAVARSGTATQLADLNRRLAAGPGLEGRPGALRYDLSPELNRLIDSQLREVRSPLPLRARARYLCCGSQSCTVHLLARSPVLRGYEHTISLRLSRRGGGREHVVQPQDASGSTYVFALDPATLVPAQDGGVLWDLNAQARIGDEVLADRPLLWADDAGWFLRPEERAVRTGPDTYAYLTWTCDAKSHVSLRVRNKPAHKDFRLTAVSADLVRLEVDSDVKGPVWATVRAMGASNTTEVRAERHGPGEPWVAEIPLGPRTPGDLARRGGLARRARREPAAAWVLEVSTPSFLTQTVLD